MITIPPGIHQHRSRVPDNHSHISSRDANYLDRALALAHDHSSGGTYDMVALWVKGSRQLTGLNRLDRPAITISEHYPNICGMHAELELYRRFPTSLRGGTLYVAGKLSNTSSPMSSTMPCKYCTPLMHSCGVRNFVFFLNQTVIKCTPEQLIW